MGLYLGGLIIVRIFLPEIWGEGLFFFFLGGGGIIGTLWYFREDSLGGGFHVSLIL